MKQRRLRNSAGDEVSDRVIRLAQLLEYQNPSFEGWSRIGPISAQRVARGTGGSNRSLYANSIYSDALPRHANEPTAD